MSLQSLFPPMAEGSRTVPATLPGSSLAASTKRTSWRDPVASNDADELDLRCMSSALGRCRVQRCDGEQYPACSCLTCQPLAKEQLHHNYSTYKVVGLGS